MNVNSPRNDKRIKIRNPYVRQGMMIFLAGFALILSYYGVSHFDVVRGFITKINDILMPFYLGLVVAYLVCPIYNWCCVGFYKITKDKFKKPHRDFNIARGLSSTVCLIFIVCVVGGIFMLIIPGMYESIMTLIPKMSGYFNNVIDYVTGKLGKFPGANEIITENMGDMSDNALLWIQEKFIPATDVIVNGIGIGVKATIGAFIDAIVALIICIYALNSKEIFKAQAKKLVLALFKPGRAEEIFELGRLSNNTFGGFINGKIIDSIIIGILCFILMTILNIPQAILISVIVGITNIIPFFGPFIGAIPSGLLLLMIDPLGCLKFIILILALQQFDGNILGPKILGKATKLSSFWVIFAIIVFGGLFGFIGMVLGVPVFAVAYTYISRGVNRKLASKNLVTDTFEYEDFSHFGIDNKHEAFKEEKPQNGQEKI